MKKNSGSIRSTVPFWRLAGVLFGLLSLMTNAEAAAASLVPGFELATARLMPGTIGQQPPAPESPSSKVNSWQGGLHIEILNGDRGVNIIKKKTAVTPVVEVRDRNNLPVAGVIVIFSSPSDGPSVTFLNGTRSYSVVTDAHGQASATSVKPLNSGNFQIKVSASHLGEVATAVIAMTNVLSAADAADNGGGTGNTAASTGGGGLSHMAIGILVGVAAAAAVGVAVGLSGHGSAAAPSTSTTATIGVGTGGTAGAPH